MRRCQVGFYASGILKPVVCILQAGRLQHFIGYKEIKYEKDSRSVD